MQTSGVAANPPADVPTIAASATTATFGVPPRVAVAANPLTTIATLVIIEPVAAGYRATLG